MLASNVTVNDTLLFTVSFKCVIYCNMTLVTENLSVSFTVTLLASLCDRFYITTRGHVTVNDTLLFPVSFNCVIYCNMTLLTGNLSLKSSIFVRENTYPMDLYKDISVSIN